MSNDDEYRRQDRESWLRIAQGYMSLLRKRPQSEDDTEGVGKSS